MAEMDDRLAPVAAIRGGRPATPGLEGEPARAVGPQEGSRQQGVEARSVWDALGPASSTGIRTEAQPIDTQLSFERDDISGRTIVLVKDPRTGATIRQIPPEEVLEVARVIGRYLGLLVDQQR